MKPHQSSVVSVRQTKSQEASLRLYLSLWGLKLELWMKRRIQGGFFIFYFRFLQKNIFSIWKFTEIYPGRPAAGRPGPGRPAAGRQGHFWKKFRGENYAQVPRGRQPGGRLSHPYIKGWLVPPPLICITKIPETKKREGRSERGEALPDFRAGDCR